MTPSIKTVLLVSFMNCAAATAFAAELPDSGQLLRETAPPAPTATGKSLRLQEEAGESKKVPAGGARIKVAGFSFAGNTVFSDNELTAMMSSHIGREMTLADLEAASGEITKAYRAKGYFLASASIPQQTVRPGMPVSIAVVEGVLERVRVETTPDDPRIAACVFSGLAGKIPVGKPADEGEIIPVVMMVNELPNITSRILLQPGTRPGTSEAVLKVTEGRPYGFTVDSDNYGNASTGRYRVAGSAELASPFRRGDLLNIRMMSSTSGDLQSVQAGYTIPLYPGGTRFGITGSYVTYTLGGDFAYLDAYGEARSLNISLTQPLFRSRHLILNATLSGEKQLLDDRNELEGSKNIRNVTSLQAGFSGLEMDDFAGGGQTAFSIGCVTGKLGIKDADALENDQSASGLGTNGEFAKLSMSLSRTQSLFGGCSLYAGAYGQLSDGNLASSEQLSLGGPSGVRAWEPGESSGDKAVVATAELRYLISRPLFFPGSMQALAFVDHGHAVLHANPVPDAGQNVRSLTGAGFGMKWFVGGGFRLQATCAWKVSGQPDPGNSPMMYIQASRQF